MYTMTLTPNKIIMNFKTLSAIAILVLSAGLTLPSIAQTGSPSGGTTGAPNNSTGGTMNKPNTSTGGTMKKPSSASCSNQKKPSNSSGSTMNHSMDSTMNHSSGGTMNHSAGNPRSASNSTCENMSTPDSTGGGR
ncbi:MAG: hypothetical protein N5P05_000417 [Chroococcopsis gigantea SAG 12.99]|jgi:hypothetical protein|nr:hypothetical protein [Chroococcopsis gigantea SAG 12.99]